MDKDIFDKYKSKESIFNKDPEETKPEKNEQKEDPNSINFESYKEKQVVEEKHNYLFNKRSLLFKLEEKWINQGEGYAMVIKQENDIKRIVFSRIGVNIIALDFYLNFDCSPQLSKKDVRFLAPIQKNEEVEIVNFACRFVDEACAEKFFKELEK